jgi:hypothetical protein
MVLRCRIASSVFLAPVIATCDTITFDLVRTLQHASGIFAYLPRIFPRKDDAFLFGHLGPPVMTARHKRRLERQFAALTSRSVRLRRMATAIQSRPGVLVRLPLGLSLIAGGFLAILPVFGLWMIPLGLLLLAIDLPLLRPFVSAAVIRLRRKWALLQRKRRNHS